MNYRMFRDKSGKLSVKRVAGALGVLVSLFMAVSKPFIEHGDKWSDALVLGILTASLGAISVGVFERNDKL